MTPPIYAVVVGGANMDLCGRSSQALRWHDSNPGTLSMSPGGVGRNIAENLARLGTPVEFISVVGQDPWGDQLLAACTQAGVGVQHVLRSAEVSTSTYLSVLDHQGEMQLALNDMAALLYLSADEIRGRAEVLCQAALWVLDANLAPETLQALFLLHQQQALTQPIVVDTVSAAKVARLKPFLTHIHTLKPNALEAEVLTGIAVQDIASAQKASAALRALGVQRVLLTLGGQGAWYCDVTHQAWYPALPVKIENVTGAGDAALAALTHAQLKEWSAEYSARFAMAAGALTATSTHTIVPNFSVTAVQSLLEK